MTQHDSREGGYALDPESQAEIGRLRRQHSVVTLAMGGLFPHGFALPNQAAVTRSDILDVACGPGSWVLGVAEAKPGWHVVGIDSSRTMIEFAALQATSLHLDNADFQEMDARVPLDFPDNSFDLVNARFLAAFMTPASWPALLHESWRVTRPGGAIRLTEGDLFSWHCSPALHRLEGMGLHALRRAGRCFSPDEIGLGIVPRLKSLLRNAGFEAVTQQAHTINFSHGSHDYQQWIENALAVVEAGLPFLIRTGQATQEELGSLLQQASSELHEPDFCGFWHFLSAFGLKPGGSTHQ
jgi:ubiquinone/menaquinone biosynthesis C-methylase UbiE